MAYVWGGLIAVVTLFAAFAIYLAATAIRVYTKFRGKRLVTCPEDKMAAAVSVNAAAAARASSVKEAHIRLERCSHWPEHENCGQECLAQIENDPRGSLVRSQVQQWFRGRACAYCQQPIEELHWHEHPPALLSPEQKTIAWNEVAPEKLPEVFETYLPVCWSCHMAETFRREHPERVVEREEEPLRMKLYH